MVNNLVAFRNGHAITSDTLHFYRHVLTLLNDNALPYMIGGAYALAHYSGVYRHTKDFDLFISRNDYERISRVLTKAGYDTELTYPHWLAKVFHRGQFIDLVFSSGNGVAEVDKDWFEWSEPAEIFDIPVRICPAEEIFWSKAFIMERERFDGADIAHLLLARGARLNWPRIMLRFGSHWRLLLSHLILFGMIYPSQRDIIPRWLMSHLIERLNQELATPATQQKICGGTLLSREQYLADVHQWGYTDARIVPTGRMSEKETQDWTRAIPQNRPH